MRNRPCFCQALCLWEYDGKKQPRLGFLKAGEKLGTQLPSVFNKNEAPQNSVVRSAELMPIPRSSLRSEGATHLAGSPRISHGKTLAVRPSVTASNPQISLFYVMMLEFSSIQAQYLSWTPSPNQEEETPGLQWAVDKACKEWSEPVIFLNERKRAMGMESRGKGKAQLQPASSGFKFWSINSQKKCLGTQSSIKALLQKNGFRPPCQITADGRHVLRI